MEVGVHSLFRHKEGEMRSLEEWNVILAGRSPKERVVILEERLFELQRLRDEQGEEAEIGGMNLGNLIVRAERELEEAIERRKDVRQTK